MIKRTTRQLSAACLLLGGAAAWAAADAPLPPPAQVIELLQRAPAYQAALLGIDAEQSVQRQYRLGAAEWTGSVSAARRSQSSPVSERSQEWELGLERSLRLPGKAAVFERAGAARVDQAQAMRRLVWREQARQLLERQGSWLREQESARLWALQLSVLEQQAEAVRKRQRLGDAARIEQQQAEAALAQAQAQAQTAAGRALSAREALERQFPGISANTATPLPAPQALPRVDEDWLQALLKSSPELALAGREHALAEAQMRLDAAETRPDPTLGLRLGRARSGAEQVLGVVLSMPFGGDYRAAGAAASASRATAAALQLAAQERRVEAEAAQRLREAQTAHGSWLRNAEAAQRLSQAAEGLARGYQLGEGSLGEVLMARRQAHEQELAAALGAVEAWLARWRLELEAGELWAEPGR